MKKLFFLLLISIPYMIMAQDFNYQQKWKEIESLAQKGEVKSLLPEIDKIYNQAKKENNTIEIIQSFIYKSKIISETTEDNENDSFKLIILDVEKEISSSKGVTKAILQSMLAKLYSEYADQSRWSRMNITESQDNSDDIGTWTTKQLLQKSSELYKESINNKELLQNEKTDNWKKILTTYDDIILYPTMYDMLVFRYIDFLSKNAYIDNNTEFNEQNKKIKNSLFQDIIKYHQNDVEKSAYLNSELKEVIEKDIPTEEKTEELLRLAKKYPKNDFSAYIYYAAANNILNTDKVKAFEICNHVADQKNNQWSTNCVNLQHSLQLPTFSVNFDQTLLPNENIPVTVTARNLDKIYYRIYEVNPTEFSLITRKNSVIDTGIFSANTKNIIKKGNIDLKHFDDYSDHSTIVRLEGLPQGNYKIEFANTVNFIPQNDKNSNLLGTSYFMVNNWSLIRTASEDNSTYQLVNRKTGQILSNISIKLFEKLNYTDKKPRILSDPINLKTDKNGFIQLPNLKKDTGYYQNSTFYIYNSESSSYIPLTSSNYYYGRDDNSFSKNNNISIFTDRVIYRPGQKVYFKAILFTVDKEKSLITKNQKVTFRLYNPNNEVVSTLDLVSNEYGSVFGEFILPQGGLTGNYYLDSDYAYSNHSFSVEEYKRPKFEVILEKPQGEYTLDKEVKASGKALSFSGTYISDAKVVYRVERQEIFPYYWWYYSIPSIVETIQQGETITDGEGKFNILFTAKSKKPLEKKDYRTYIYTLYADVTDINGETHTSETQITIGDLPKKLNLQIPEKATQKEFKQIIISSTSLNDVKLPSQGNINIIELIAPKKIILPNKIEDIPEYQLYDEKTFNQYFPHLPYSKEEQTPALWKRGKEISYFFNTEKSDTVAITESLSRGYYLIQATTLYGKDSIQTQKVIEILDNQTLKSTDNLFFSIRTDKKSYKVGETITLNLLSDLEGATGILHIESGGKWIIHKDILLKGGKGSFSLQANQEYVKDGLFVTAYVIKENGYRNQTLAVQILNQPKDLKITTKVFRDKITPGAEEKWELTVSGADKDKVTAEVLATMYDASLDQFQSNTFSFSPWGYSPYGILYNHLIFFGYKSKSLTLNTNYKSYSHRIPQEVNIKDFPIYFSRWGDVAQLAVSRPMMDETQDMAEERVDKIELSSLEERKTKVNPPIPVKPSPQISEIQIRTNLQETAFFYPNLYTDKNGNVKLSFTSPEALTKWKLLILAHTQDLKSGTAEFYAQTQKELMVVPNVPRFLREGDEITISTKITNLSSKKLAGQAQLLLWDALNNNSVDAEFLNSNSTQTFQADTSQNTEISWNIKVPKNIQAVTYRIVAKAGGFSDGEENILPVLTNRMLVTETLPISIKENQTKEFRIDKLVMNQSKSLQNFNLSVELTTNPIWLAVMSLPYLREYPYECSEQLFSRLYGNILSSYIINSSPKIKKVFDNWNTLGINISNLEKNQELKNILLEETPWIKNAENENEQKKRIALFFDLNQMKNETQQAQNKLIKRQNENGGFAWFEGGSSSSNITEHIILGFGQLKFMLKEKANTYLLPSLKNVIKSAIDYSDQETIKYINSQLKQKQKIDGKSLIQYYYVRSFWKDEYKVPTQITKYLKDITKDISVFFKNYDLQSKAMTALVLNRYGYSESAKKIIQNIKETSVESDEMGMYWKDNQPGWYWYQAPIDTQARLIEAFSEIKPSDVHSVEEMKVWLLKNRQTNAWNSTKATTNAVYALMNFGKDWTDSEKGVNAWVGNTQLFPSVNSSIETASGYIKQSWNAEQIKPEMGVVKVEKNSPGVAWGGIYWQYFEDLDKITQTDTNIKIQKQLFLKINTDQGQQLQLITNKNSIKVGDLVTVKLIIKVDRDMQYIHIKDMRASGFEPVNVLSGYKFQNRVGYYESTRDAATNFFFEFLPKGIYNFEYDLRANNKGEFSNGITQLQNMYAPEMSAYSEGKRINIR